MGRVRCRNPACFEVLGRVRDGGLVPRSGVTLRVYEFDHATGVDWRYRRTGDVELICPRCGWSMTFRWPESEAS